MAIYEEFKRITGFELLPRQTNYLSNRVERKDPLFPQLTIIYFSDPQKFKRCKQRIRLWLKKEHSETTFALAGYIYYIIEDFKKAKNYFLKTVSINPDNLDNWIDLAFSLRQLGEYRVSNGIIFNHNYAIYYYKYLKLVGCSYSKIKKLVLEIMSRASNA